MNLNRQMQSGPASHLAASAVSPVASDRIRALASRIVGGAPALTAGEMREFADAILEHNALSEQRR